MIYDLGSVRRRFRSSGFRDGIMSQDGGRARFGRRAAATAAMPFLASGAFDLTGRRHD
jgi:hypothetical protein